MAEKTDEQIIEELGLEQNPNNEETSNSEQNDSLQPIEQNESTNDSTNVETDDENSINSIENEDFDEEPVQKKKPKIFKILTIAIAALSLVLTIGTVLYLTGFFDEEQPKKQTELKAKPLKIEQKEEIDISNIDKKKLNQKLQMLTKTEILNKEELEAEERKIAEEKKKEEEAKQKAIEEEKRKEEERKALEKEALEKEKQLLIQRQEAIKKEQEEFLRLQEEIKKEIEQKRKELLNELNGNKNIKESSSTSVNEIINNAISTTSKQTQEMQEQSIEEPIANEISSNNDEMNSNLFLSFINVAIINGNLQKSFLDKIEEFDKKISLCRDSKNRIEIYFGPYDSNEQREKVFTNLVENGFKDSFLVDFTKEEYEKRCNY